MTHHLSDPDAPFGREPFTGAPYSDRHRIVAAVLQFLMPFGIGRFYMGDKRRGLAQLLLSPLVVGLLWGLVDSIVIVTGRPLDQHGRPLRH
jgi:TM2 domain-containing membrane protein YozV